MTGPPHGQGGFRDQTGAEKAPYLLGKQVLRSFSEGDVAGDTIGAARRGPGDRKETQGRTGAPGASLRSGKEQR